MKEASSHLFTAVDIFSHTSLTLQAIFRWASGPSRIGGVPFAITVSYSMNSYLAHYAREEIRDPHFTPPELETALYARVAWLFC